MQQTTILHTTYLTTQTYYIHNQLERNDTSRLVALQHSSQHEIHYIHSLHYNTHTLAALHIDIHRQRQGEDTNRTYVARTSRHFTSHRSLCPPPSLYSPAHKPLGVLRANTRTFQHTSSPVHVCCLRRCCDIWNPSSAPKALL